jgi:uncharacterized protein (DUF1501 family)
MLTIFTGGKHRSCDGLTRRDFIRAGALALGGGFALPELLRARAAASEAGTYLRERSVVFLWLGGGPSQIETFDPKMSAPEEIRSVTGEIKTALPGVTVGGTFPLLANLLDRVTIFRSFATGTADHATGPKAVLAGQDGGSKDRDLPSVGSVYARLRGTTHPATGMPTHVLLTAPEIAQEFRYQKSWLADGATAGRLGGNYGPFHPDGEITGGKGDTPNYKPPPLLDNMQLKLPADHLDDRRLLLGQLDKLARSADAFGGSDDVDRFRQQAYEVLRTGVARAFDLSKEDAKTVDRYDTGALQVGHKKGGYRPSTLGKQMLLARRLCEAGAGFVLVQNSGWDMHDDGNNCGMVEGMNMLGPELDHAVAAFLEDVKARGLDEQILLVVTGEMGRTPKKQGKGGRNHWSGLAPLLVAGGGLKMGQVVGESDKSAATPATPPVRPSHLMATVLQTLFDPGQLRLQPGLPRDLVQLVVDGKPIAELMP